MGPKGCTANVHRHEKIIKPASDTQQYRGLVLSNHLKVMLVSDPTTDKSAGALSVLVGSLADPWDRQGMAHFLEHALFLTTRKYPEENFFKNYVVGHGGHTANAFTQLDETCYYFDVGTDALEGALDRFAQFFMEPLFPKELIARELQSIQFEFENTITSDGHRFFRVRKAHCVENSEFSKFETGNNNTLKISDELFKAMSIFFNTWYSSNIMTLSVLGKEPLDKLEQMVVPLFSQIVNRHAKPLVLNRHPYPPSQCRLVAKILPFRETRKLIMYFPIPDVQHDLAQCDALAYITFLLGHEGPGSLLSELKAHDYSTVLEVEYYFFSGFGFLDIEVNLTQGITKNDEIITLLFQFIKLLKSVPPQKRIYDEIRQIHQIKYNYRDKIDPMPLVKYLCHNMHFYPFERVNCAQSVMGEFDPNRIKSLINLFTPETFNLQVVSPIFKSQGLNFLKDPIYGTEYVIEPIPQESLDKWINCPMNPKLKLPGMNDFIPQNFALLPPEKSNTQSPKGTEEDFPELVYNQDQLRVWHLQDKKYKAPKVFYGFAFKSPLANQSPLNNDCVSLFGKIFFDFISQKFYSADIAGINYNVSTNRFGVEISAQGFNDKLDNFVCALVSELTNFRIQPNRYTIMKDLHLNALQVFNQSSISTLLHSNLDTLLMPNLWTSEEMIEAFPQVNGELVLILMKSLFKNCQVEAFCHGNLTKASAISLSQKVMYILTGGEPLNPASLHIQLDKNRDIQLPIGICELVIPSEKHESHGFLLYQQMGMQDLKSLARIELLHQMIKEHWFNQIRMAEQLAYVTFCTLKYSSAGSVGICFLIQSAYSLSYLESRVEAFIESLEKTLTNLKTEGFNKERKALITKIREQPKSMYGQSHCYWREITSCQYIFGRENEMIAHLSKLKLNDILSLYRTTLKTGGARCRRLIVAIKSKKCKEMQPNEATPVKKEIKKIPKDNGKKEYSKKHAAKSKSGEKSAPISSHVSQEDDQPPQRRVITNIRKFRCECALCPIPKVILDKL